MNEWAQLVAAAAGSGVLGAIVTGAMNRKKLGADATQVITDAAASTVTSIAGELERSRETNVRLEKQLAARDAAWRARDERDRVRDRRQARMDQESRDVLQQHAASDHLLLGMLREAQSQGYLVGVDIPVLPPLYPPASQRDEVQPIDSERDVDSSD